MTLVISIYIFIVLGFSAKHIFKEKIDANSINLLSVFFLQPILTLWGLLGREINTDHLSAPFFYLLIISISALISFLIAKTFFNDPKERSIASIAALVGNTGNLGIPLGIALFGEVSIPYTTLINLANVFVVYTFGVYFYSRGSFNTKQSLMQIVKLPTIWFAIFALTLNYLHVEPIKEIKQVLIMGAYASMVIQLMLFGIYLRNIKLSELNLKLLIVVTSIKFLLIPILTFMFLQFSSANEIYKGVLFMELFMPLAVANVNLSALYNCRPTDVTALIFITSILFLGLFLLIPKIIMYL